MQADEDVGKIALAVPVLVCESHITFFFFLRNEILLIRGKKSSWMPTKPDPTATTPFSSPTCSSVRSYPHDFFSLFQLNKIKYTKERTRQNLYTKRRNYPSNIREAFIWWLFLLNHYRSDSKMFQTDPSLSQLMYFAKSQLKQKSVNHFLLSLKYAKKK